jgi:pyruvate dehydrogenase E1 component beta subunit
LDNDAIIASVTKTGKLLVVHEACQTAGWAGEIMAVVSGSSAFDYLDAPMRRLAGTDTPIPYSRGLERAAVPQEEDIEREIRAILKGKY